MTPVVLSSPARADLHDIWEFVAAESEQSADRLIDKISEAMFSLADFPLRGHVPWAIADLGILSLTVGNWLVLYQVRADAVDILRVVHGARDLRHLDL